MCSFWFFVLPLILCQVKSKVHLNAKCISNKKQNLLVERNQVKGEAKIQDITSLNLNAYSVIVSVDRFVTLSGSIDSMFE